MTPSTNDNGTATPLTIARYAAGAIVAAVTVLVGACHVAALVNPWHLVVLDRYFGSPFLGLMWVGIGGYLALRLLLPVRNEAVQRVRFRVRAIPIVAAGLGFLAWGVFGVFLNTTGDYEEIARTPDGERAIGLVSYDRDNRELHVWVGDGLGMRDVGNVGKVCGQQVHADFVNPDLIEVDTGYGGPWEIELDPDTAEPLAELGPHCSDGPMPTGAR